ncbi:MAG: polysaccharide deacetylase family protein [Bacteroidetes bacterium]|nr:polysaccharide deacetylase family protein [Bacteroidota bacterium]
MITHTGIVHRTLFPSLLWRMPGKKVYLTFDDGPHPTATETVLDALKRHDVRATFFLTGKNIPGREQIVRRIEDEGHSIGIHAYNHTRSMAFSKHRTTEEIRRTAELISTVVRQKVRLFRPPFGFFSWNTIAAAREQGYLLVMWSCLTGDFRLHSNESVVKNSLEQLSYGSILVFHDNDLTQDTIANLLDIVIPQIRQRGFEFGAIR